MANTPAGRPGVAYEGVPAERIRDEIAQCAHLCAAAGLANAFEGNISVRAGNRVYETPTSTSKELMRPEQVICIDMEGRQLEGDLRPTSETCLHLACYRERADVSAVVHCHAPFCTSFAQADADFVDDASAEVQVLFGGRIPCVAYGTQGTPAIAADLPAHIQDHDVMFLAHHGVVAVGKSPLDAYSKVQSAEGLIKTYFIRSLLFGQRDCSLPADEIARLLRMHEGR